jgi:ribulose bisphosphate carboxylase small subunit
MERVAICARVLTDDKARDPQNQVRQLRCCAGAGHEIAAEYVSKRGTFRTVFFCK